MGDRELEYSPAVRKVETLAISVFAGLAMWSAWSMAGAPIGVILAAALLGWLATDFFSGLVHWAFDTYGSVDTPFLGQWFIRPFREHHDEPRAMTKHDFVETNGSSAIAALPLLVAGGAMPVEGLGWAFGQAFMLFLALGGLMANQCHKWGHMRQAELEPMVRLAQQMRLVLSPVIHRSHHARPHNSHYCTANGWMNGVLEAGRFFRGLERMLALMTRTMPRKGEIG